MIQKKYLAIIPARKGSKGLPNKNILPFSGVPLFLNTYNILNSSKYEIDIYVSTDSDEIISICNEEKINYVRRPPEISNDNSTTEEAISHLLSKFKSGSYDFLILAQCTSPLLEVTDVNSVIQYFESKENEIDSIFTCYECHIPFWEINNDNKLVRVSNLEKVRQPRQKSKPLFIENGALYLFKINSYVKSGTRFCGITDKFIMSKTNSIDIDDSDDFQLADLIKNNLNKTLNT